MNKKLSKRALVGWFGLILLQISLVLAGCKTTQKPVDPNMGITKYGVPTNFQDR